jgi:hypothetical protein
MSGLSSILSTVAPMIATALGGPLAGAAVSFLASKLGVDPAIVEQTVAGMTPAQLVQMKELDNQFNLEMAKVGISLDLAQIAVNTTEGANASVFVAGWRPFVGWTCGVGLAYVAIMEPIARFIAKVGFAYNGAFPVIDTSLTMQVLIGMLGMGAMRSMDKKNGVSTTTVGNKK